MGSRIASISLYHGTGKPLRIIHRLSATIVKLPVLVNTVVLSVLILIGLPPDLMILQPTSF